MSFGLRKAPSPSIQPAPPVPDMPESSYVRDRATTISSYASTAVPPRLDANIGASDFGSDFGNMFEGLEAPSKRELLPPPPTLGGMPRSVRLDNTRRNFDHYTNNARQESEPLFPPRTASRQAHTPSPDPEPRQRPQPLGPAKRYSWASRTSNDGLMSPSYESDMASPRSGDFSMGDSLQAPSAFNRFRPGYQPVPDRFQSPSPTPEVEDIQPEYISRQQVRPVSDVSDEDTTVNSTQHVPTNGYRTHDASAKLQEATLYTEPAIRVQPAQSAPSPIRHPAVMNISRDDSSATGSTTSGSQNTTPRPKKLELAAADEALFDVSPAGPASRAVRPTVSPRRLTKAQFEQQQRYTAQATQEVDSDQDEEPYDEQDDAERHAELTRQRRKQEASLAVYRQQMKKVSGGNPSELPTQPTRPGFDRAFNSAPGLGQSMSSMSLGMEQVEEEDDDVPLGILQAHGFPNKNRPPIHLSAPNTPGSAFGDAGGSLPPFARRLPADPYFGAGLVSPANREALAYGNSGGSVYGGAPAVQPMHPGGLVGVIAGEERARAARRGSPSGAGGFGAMPLPTNMQQMPMMPRSNSMMSVMGPQMGGYMGGMPPMMSPSEMQTQQQMMQMMAMQQQMMQQMVAMQNGQMPQFAPPQMPGQNGFLNLPNGAQRPMSIHSNGGRTMSMMNPPAQWNDNTQQQRASTMSSFQPLGYAGSVYDFSLGGAPQGYTPSIAPSERSNIGMPSRYRPVTAEGIGSASNSRTQTMTSEGTAQALSRHNASTSSFAGANAVEQPKSTIRVIDKAKGTPKAQQTRVEDEDEEEGWAQMRKKKEERKRRNTQTKSSQALEELYQTFE